MKRLYVLLSCALFGASAFAQSSIFNVRLNEVLANGTILKNTNGHALDIIELYNTGGDAVDLTGATLTDSDPVPPKFTFPANSVIPAGGYFVVYLDPDNLVNNFGLSGKGDTLKFAASDGTPIEDRVFGFQIPDLSIGRYPDGGDWTLTQPTFGSANVTNAFSLPGELTDPLGLKINEWYAAGPDFIELYNPSPSIMSIGDLRISDQQNNGFNIPSLSFLGTGKLNGFVAFRDNSSDPEYFLSFGLGKSGDSITVTRPDSVVVDYVSFGAQANDVSQGRLPDGSTNVISFEKRLTPGSPNFGLLTSIVINEILTHTDPPLEDAVELLNVTDAPIDISGWIMTDDPEKNPKRFVFPSGSIIQPHGFLVLYEYQFKNQSDPPEYTFNSAHGDTNFILQVDANSNVVAYLEQRFGAAANGVSFGRITNSDGDVDFVAMECRSFGNDYNLPLSLKGLQSFRQGTGKPNCAPKWGPAIISEIMYHPTDTFGTNNVLDEYIEIRNVTGARLPMFDLAVKTNRWKIDGGVGFEFKDTDYIDAGGYLLLVSFDPGANPAQLQEFRTRYSITNSVPIRGPYTNKLGNGDDIIALYRPDPPQGPTHSDFGFVPYILTDRVHYEPGAYWPTNSDGTGSSLQRINTPGYADEPLSWFDDQPSPCRANNYLIITQQPQNTPMRNLTNGTLSVVVQSQGTYSNVAPPGYQWFFKNKPMAGATANTLQITNVSRRNQGAYYCVITNAADRVMSQSATVTAIAPIVIKTQPQSLPKSTSKPLYEGSRAVFKTKATGSKPIFYWWFKDGIFLTNETNSTLTIPVVDPSMNGSYHAVVSNVITTATSFDADLTVTPRP